MKRFLGTGVVVALLLLVGWATEMFAITVAANHLIGTGEVSLVEEVPCNNSDQAQYDCFNFKAMVDADHPSTTLDDPLLPTNVILSVRYKKGTPLTNRWIVFEAGGHGNGYGPAFGRVRPGEYLLGGGGYGDDLIRWYNELGYLTLDVVWECDEVQNGGPCANSPLAGWVPEYANGTGWFRNTGGAGYVGIGSRTRAILEWAMANNGGHKVGAHGQSSGTGRLMTVLTRYGGEPLFDTVVFDGGPVMSYTPWYCGITDDGNPNNGAATPGSLGPKAADFDIEAYSISFRDNYDNARDPNNGEGQTRYRNCTNHVWDEAAMMADANFYQAGDRDFATVDMAMILGGNDTTPASPHGRFWFHGYTYGAESIPALSAKSLTIRQGYCAPGSGGTYFANQNARPCTDWASGNFPTASEVAYVSAIAGAGHPTAQSLVGATELFNVMLRTLELVPNNPPTISDIADQTTDVDTPTAAIAFTVGDVETPTASLVVTGSSSNTTLVPITNIVFGGSGANRTVTMTPAANQSGTATITVTVTDGNGASASDSFVLTVNASIPTVSQWGLVTLTLLLMTAATVVIRQTRRAGASPLAHTCCVVLIALMTGPAPGTGTRTRRGRNWKQTMNVLHQVSAGLLLFATISCSGGGTATDGKPARLPALASIGLYATSSPFNQAIAADAEVDPASDTLVGSLVAAGTMVIQVRQYSTPVYFAAQDTPRRDVRLACGPDWELGVTALADVPIPDFAEPGFDADGETPPVGCGTESDQDNNMVVFDLERRCEWDFWQVRRDAGGWVASWGNGISLDGSGIYPKGLSTRGSGFAFPGGVIWPDELADGEIRHALAFSYPYTRVGGPVAPAVDSDGVTDAPDAIPEGALVQLDPALDLDAFGLTPTGRTIARALQVYGMYLVDTGGEAGIGLYAVDPRSVSQDPYAAILAPDEAFLALDGMPIESLRVLRLGPQDPDFTARLAVEENPCVSFR